MNDVARPFALKWALSRTDSDVQDIIVMTARMIGAGGPEYLDPSEQSFSEHEQMLFTKAVSVAESFGKHISLLGVPAADIFSALVQTANSLEVAMLISGLSSTLTAQEQAFQLGHAWETLPQPKRQFTYIVVHPEGRADTFHIGPHEPALRADDIQLVHRLWLNISRDPGMSGLHHSDIVTYALTRLASDYARDKSEILQQLRRLDGNGTPSSPALASATSTSSSEPSFTIRAPRSSFEDKGDE